MGGGGSSERNTVENPTTTTATTTATAATTKTATAGNSSSLSELKEVNVYAVIPPFVHEKKVSVESNISHRLINIFTSEYYMPKDTEMDDNDKENIYIYLRYKDFVHRYDYTNTPNPYHVTNGEIFEKFKTGIQSTQEQKIKPEDISVVVFLFNLRKYQERIQVVPKPKANTPEYRFINSKALSIQQRQSSNVKQNTEDILLENSNQIAHRFATGIKNKNQNFFLDKVSEDLRFY